MEHPRRNTEVTDDTRRAEAEEATASHQPDRLPTPEEQDSADAHQADPEVARHARDMNRVGAEARGEGRVP